MIESSKRGKGNKKKKKSLFKKKHDKIKTTRGRKDTKRKQFQKITNKKSFRKFKCYD